MIRFLIVTTIISMFSLHAGILDTTIVVENKAGDYLFLNSFDNDTIAFILNYDPRGEVSGNNFIQIAEVPSGNLNIKAQNDQFDGLNNLQFADLGVHSLDIGQFQKAKLTDMNNDGGIDLVLYDQSDNAPDSHPNAQIIYDIEQEGGSATIDINYGKAITILETQFELDSLQGNQALYFADGNLLKEMNDSDNFNGNTIVGSANSTINAIAVQGRMNFILHSLQ